MLVYIIRKKKADAFSIQKAKVLPSYIVGKYRGLRWDIGSSTN